MAAIAVVVVGGAVLAVVARDVRATILGLLIVLLGTPLVADPWPGLAPIVARVAAALLAARLLVVSLRGDVTTSGTRIGWPAEALLAGAAAVVGIGSHGLGAVPLGSAEAQAAGFALVAIAVPPLATGRDVLRLGVGAVLLLAGALLVRAGLNQPPSDGEHLVAAFLTIALGGAIAIVATTARAGGGLDAVEAEGRRPHPPDAHRSTDRERTGPAARLDHDPSSVDRAAGRRSTLGGADAERRGGP